MTRRSRSGCGSTAGSPSWPERPSPGRAGSPYPPTPWNASPRDSYGTPGPYEDAVQGSPIFEENGPDGFKGIDIMRTVRSFDPCLPCGVHMYLGGGRTLRQTHSPTFGAVS